MKKRIINYRKQIDDLLANNSENVSWSEEVKEHLIQIGFFQHERIVHLIVTMTVALLTIITLAIGIIAEYVPAFILMAGFMVLLVPYIFHYYTLENEVQKMYEQYDKMLSLSKRVDVNE